MASVTEPSGTDVAVGIACTLAAGRAVHAERDLDALLDQAGIDDEQERERAHQAFAAAFPISYRRWRADRLNRA